MNRLKKILAPLGWGAVFAMAGALAAGSAGAAYPDQPITLVVPSAPGGSTDVGGRLYAGALSEALGQPVVVSNRPGGGLTIGSAAVANAPADGYTLLFTINAPISIAKFTIPNLTYDPQTSFEPISLLARTLNIVVANSKFAPNTLQEVIDHAKANPGKLRFGTPGIGTPDHIALEMINDKAGTDIVHVPYKGGSPMITDLRGGFIELGIASLVTVAPLLQSGDLKAIALVETERYDAMPELPIVDEVIPGVGRPTWFGVFAPAGTPADVIEKLNAVSLEILARPEIAERFQQAGLVPVGTTAQALKEQVDKDVGYFGDLIKRLNVEIAR